MYLILSKIKETKLHNWLLINKGLKIRKIIASHRIDAQEAMLSRRVVYSDGEISIDLLELMYKKAFNRRQLSSPTISDDYPIAVLKEV